MFLIEIFQNQKSEIGSKIFENLSDFVSLNLKLHNLYCHNSQCHKKWKTFTKIFVQKSRVRMISGNTISQNRFSPFLEHFLRSIIDIYYDFANLSIILIRLRKIHNN